MPIYEITKDGFSYKNDNDTKNLINNHTSITKLNDSLVLSPENYLKNKFFSGDKDIFVKYKYLSDQHQCGIKRMG